MKANIPELKDESFDLTPMIDVVFLLIIFFMVVAAEITEKIEIEMPKAEKAEVPEETGRRMNVSVQEDGSLFIGLMPTTLEELGKAVRRDNETVPGFKVFVRADANVAHKHVRDVMKTCAENGVFDIIFATYKQ